MVVHIFDTQNEYADVLAPAIPGSRLLIVDVVRDAKINLWDNPPRVSHYEWAMQHMPTYLGESFFWYDRTLNLYRKTCDDVLRKYGMITAARFAAAYAELPAGEKRLPEFGSLERFITMLRIFPTFQCAVGEDLEEAQKTSRIWEMRDAPDDLRNLLASHITTFFEKSREYQRDRDLDLILVFDEMSQFFTKDSLKRYQGRADSFYLRLLRTDRKWGIGVIVADQNYTMIHDVVRSNCQIKIGMDMRDAGSRRQFAMDLGLNQEQEHHLAELSYKRERRRAVVQLPHYPRPFLMEIPNIEKPEPLTPEQMEGRRSEMRAGMKWTPEEKPTGKAEPEHAKVTHEMEAYLGTIANHWTLSATGHDRAMKNWSPAKGTRTRQALQDLGLIEEYIINLGLPGKQIKIVLPTKAGYELLDRKRIGYETPRGNGSIVHKWWQTRIAEQLRKDKWKTEIEQCLGSKRVDVGAVNDLGVKVAYEILVEGLKKECLNWAKDLADGWHSVVYVVDTYDTRDRLAALLPDSMEDVSIRLRKEFA